MVAPNATEKCLTFTIFSVYVLKIFLYEIYRMKDIGNATKKRGDLSVAALFYSQSPLFYSLLILLIRFPP